MSYTRAVAYNTIIQIIGKVLTTIISLFLVASLTRYLGVSGYGDYTIVFAYTQFFAVLADFGFFWILVRELARPGADLNKTVSNILTFRTIIGIGAFLLAFLIGFFIPQYANLRLGIGIIALASLWLTLNSTYIGVFQNKLRMDKAAITDILGRLAILLLTLYFIRQDLGLYAILWAYVLGNLLNFVASAWLGRIYIHFRPAFDFEYWKKIFREALPMGIVLILGLLYFRIDSVMLSLMRTPEDVGIYGPPYKILEIILLLPSMFMGNVFPIVTRYLFTQDSRLNNALQKSFDFLVMLALPIAVGIIFIAERIIRIVAGGEFLTAHTIAPVWGLPATSSTALQILIVAVCLSFLSNLFGYLVIAVGKQSKMIWPYASLVVFNILMNLILIPKISYIGAAITTVLTEVFVLFFSWWIARRNIIFHLNLKILWQAGLSGLVLGIFLYFFAGFLNLLILIPLGALIYAAVLWAVGAIDKGILKTLIQKES